MMPIFRQAFRTLRLSPAFSLTVIATLAIGIGLNAAIFTVVDNVLLQPLGFHDADRIVAIRTHFHEEGRSIPRLGGDDYVDLARSVQGLQATAQFQQASDGFSLNGVTQYAPITVASAGFTEVMGVQPLVGRLFRAGDRNGADALLSARFVRDHFPSISAALGQSITYSGKLYTVVGVLPDGFHFPNKSEAWFETAVEPGNRTSYNWQVLGKRREGTSASQLRAELATFSSRLSAAYNEDRKKSIEAVPLQEQLVFRLRPTFQLLMGSVAVILLIVCANITHLQLVRATRNLRATTIRAALGASRTALVLRGLAETLLLALAGTLVALLLALPAVQALAHMAPRDVPRLDEVHLNFDVFFVSVLVSIVLMAVSALLPIWHAWRVDAASALRSDASRGTESRNSLRLRNGFLVAEVALTLTLSVAAILLTRQLIAQSRQDLGFSPDRLLTLDSHAVTPVAPNNGATLAPDAVASVPLAQQKAERDAKHQADLARLQSTIASAASVPGVASAAAIAGAPLGFGGSNVGYAIRGRTVFETGDKMEQAEVRPVTSGFFKTMGVPVLRGRALGAGDTDAAPTVLLINKVLADTVFPNADPIGQQIMCGYDEKASWWTIVGVVGNIRAEAPGLPPTATFYVPVAQHPDRATDMQIVVRTQTDPAVIGESVREALRRSHPEVAVKSTTMRTNLATVQQAATFRTTLFMLFAGVSILLAAIGMYGVTAYTVAQRRFEFGLKIALGASRGQLLFAVLGKAVVVALIGVVTGTALSLALQRVLGSIVGELPAFDGVAYVLATLTVLTLALLATLVPANRAAGVDPMTVLRSE